MSEQLLDVPVRLTGAAVDSPAPGAEKRTLMTPWRLVALVATAALLAFKSMLPFVDPDVYWHVELGREILRERGVVGTGTDWAFTLPGAEWTTTQWLSEVVFTAVHAWAGWSGIALLRVALALACAATLALVLLRQRRSPWSAVVYSLVLVVVSTAWQERPQMFSFVLLVWLAWHCRRVLQGATGTPLAGVFLVTALWANLHGMWVLVPACLGVAVVGRLLTTWVDRSESRLPRWQPLAAPLVALTAVCLTPVGPALVLTPLRFASATASIDEWQPTAFEQPYMLVYGVILLLVLVGWARSPVPAGEVLYVLVLVAFSMLAARNVVPATILLAPVVLDRVNTLWPRRDEVDTGFEGKVLAAVAVVIILVFGAYGWATWRTATHVPPSLPVGLAQELQRDGGDLRVLNEYELGGVLIHWGGDRVRVAIDGRADRYGSAYIDEYQDLLAMRGGWEATLRRLDPDTAVLHRGTPLVRELLVHRGWRETGSESGYLLLRSG